MSWTFFFAGRYFFSHSLCGFASCLDCRIFFSTLRCHQIWEYHSWIWSLVSDNLQISATKCFKKVPRIIKIILSVFVYRFNYRATAYMVEHGYYKFLNWFDERAWYPLGKFWFFFRGADSWKISDEITGVLSFVTKTSINSLQDA